VAHRYIASQFPGSPPAGRFVSLLGDAELDEDASTPAQSSTPR
jgi:pyruvate dehydrogenase E1 component